jgi:uncharacterized protein DUF5678
MEPKPTSPPEPPLSVTATATPDQPIDGGPVPDEELNEWRWIFRAREEGGLSEFVGKHIAVVNQKVVASHEDLRRLNAILRDDLHLDPDRVVTALID